MIHNYRWRLGLAAGEPKYDELEKRLAKFPVITVPTITLEGDANGAPHPDPSAYAKKFSGKYAHRLIEGGIGHNLPQEARRPLLKPWSTSTVPLEVDSTDHQRSTQRQQPRRRNDDCSRGKQHGAGKVTPRSGSTSHRTRAAVVTARPSGSTPATHPEGTAGKGGADRRLDVYVHQLAAHPSVRPRVGREVQEQGLVVIGVHTPEFPFEKNIENVRQPPEACASTIRSRSTTTTRYGAHSTTLLAGALFRRCAGRIRHHQFGEGELRAIGSDHSATADRGGKISVDHDLVAADAHGSEAAADWRNLSPRKTISAASGPELRRLPAVRLWPGVGSTPPPPLLRLNHWALSASGRWGRCP